MAYVAKMDHPAHDEGGPVLLNCLICKLPKPFSDLSHLLTHIAAKTHLQKKFELEIESIDNPEAELELEAYLQWENNNGIKLLVKGRKDAKKNSKKPGNAAKRRTGTTRTNGSASSANNRGQRQNKRRVAGIENHALKAEPDVIFAAPVGFPPMGHFNTAAMNSHHLQEANRDLFSDNAAFPGYPDSIKNERAQFAFDPFSNDPFRAGLLPILRSNTQTPDSAIPSSVDLDLTEDGNPKLKGTVYQGMGLFDSATPDQKRKRNQRKAQAVIDQMKTSSLTITATECIWTPGGEFQRSRDIYADPSEDEGQDEVPFADNQKKKRAKRSVKRRAPVPTDAGRGDAEEAPSSIIRPGLRSSARLAGRNRLLGDHGDDDIADSIVVKQEKKPAGGRRTKKPEGFDIFQDPRQDSPGRTMSPSEDKRSSRLALPSLGYPAPSLTPVAGRFTLPTQSTVPLADMSTNESMTMASPTPATKQHSARYYANPMDANPMGANLMGANPMDARSFPFPQPTTFAPSYLPGLSGSTHNPLFGNPQQRVAMGFHNRSDAPVFDDSQLTGSLFSQRFNYSPFNMGGAGPFDPQPRDNNNNGF